MELKVSTEQATTEINGWLEYKRVSQKKRETYKDAIDNLIDALSMGTISLNDNYEIVHNLIFPIENKDGAVALDKLVYKPRIDIATISKKQQEVKTTGSAALIMTYVSALTGIAMGILNKMDTEDNGIAQSIGVFFV